MVIVEGYFVNKMVQHLFYDVDLYADGIIEDCHCAFRQILIRLKAVMSPRFLCNVNIFLTMCKTISFRL
jgi:hypothetical protein